ncbi:MAG: hypothetical protein ACI4U2_05235 [Christensenellaceae bacterium]
MRALSAEEAEITERYLTKLTCGVQYWYRGDTIVPIALLTQEEIDEAKAELSRMREFLKEHAAKSLFLVTRKEAELAHPARMILIRTKP